MFKGLGKSITKSLVIGIFIGVGILIAYAADITSISQTVTSGDKIKATWFNAINTGFTDMGTSISNINTKLTNISSSGANVGIGTNTPEAKLHIDNGTIIISNNTGSPRLKLVNTSLGLVTAAPSWEIDNASDLFRIFRQPNISTSGVAHFVIDNTGKVGIGTSAPTQKLEVNGTIKATNLETLGEHIEVSLAHCGGACPGVHAYDTRVNVSAYNLTWSTIMNTAATNFTHNGKGTVTVAKAGLYLIETQSMTIPAAAAAWFYTCPVINGTASCGPLGAGDGLQHGYYPAGRRAQCRNRFYKQLAAGTTVGYAYYYHSGRGVTHWANDTYTNFKITRVQ